MPTLLPHDADNNVIPALRLKSGGAHSIASSAVSAKNATAFDVNTKIISMYASEPVYINFGDLNVTATTNNHYFPAFTYYDLSIGGGATGHYTHIAVLAAGADGMVYISEKE